MVARLPSELGLIAVAVARASGKPYLVEVVGCAADSYRTFGSAAGRIYAPLAALRMRRAVADAPLVIYVTEHWLQERYPTRGICVVASNVEMAPPDDAVRARRTSRLASLTRGRVPVLGTIGSLTSKRKGIQHALAALGQLKQRGVVIPYRVLGEGNTAPWLAAAQEHGIADLVRFDGTAPNREAVMAWLDDVDLYIQPSLSEGLPRATIEAMSRGCACLGSEVGGIPELLPPSRRFPAGDQNAIARLVGAMASDPAAITAASEDAFIRSHSFDPELLTEQRDRVLGELADRAENAIAGRPTRRARVAA
jgi:glycosyltransferase involved in cell wall biosynthesis